MMKEKIKKIVSEYAPEWKNNENFLLNVETLCYGDYDEETIIDAINTSISDYEEGLTKF